MESYLRDLSVKLRGHQSRLDHSEEFISDNVKKMKLFGIENVLVWLLNNENGVYTFMLLFPEIWRDFNKDAWENIMLRVNRPTNLRRFKDERGYFDDIIFLFRFIKIDSLEWIMGLDKLSVQEKLNTFKYFLMRPDELLQADYDEINFEKGYFCEKTDCINMQKRLLSQGLHTVAAEITEDFNQYEKPLELILKQLQHYISQLDIST